MSRPLRRLLLAAGVGAALYGLRHRLLDLLTRTTGTWIGTPR